MHPLHRQLRTYWAGTPGLVVRGPAAEHELLKLEKRVGKLPATFRSFLLFADGFSDEGAGCDENGFVFWPMSRMELVNEYKGGGFSSQSTGELLLFADYLNWSWAYAIRLSEKNECDEVFMVGTADGVPFRVATTFEDFLKNYLADDATLYGS